MTTMTTLDVSSAIPSCGVFPLLLLLLLLSHQPAIGERERGLILVGRRKRTSVLKQSKRFPQKPTCLSSLHVKIKPVMIGPGGKNAGAVSNRYTLMLIQRPERGKNRKRTTTKLNPGCPWSCNQTIHKVFRREAKNIMLRIGPICMSGENEESILGSNAVKYGPSIFVLSGCSPRGQKAHALRAHRSRGLCPTRCSTGSSRSVVAHVSLDEMASSERTAQAKLTGQDTGGNDAGELTSIVAWLCHVSATHAEKIEHR